MGLLDTVFQVGILAVYVLAILTPPVHNLIGRRRRDKELRRGAAYSLIGLFRTAGRQLGLDLARVSLADGPELRGRLDDCEVVVTGARTGHQAWATTVTARPKAPLLSEVSVRTRWQPATSTLRDTTLAGTTDAGTGDDAFDALFQAGGQAPSARALLTAAVRGALIALARAGVVRVDARGLAYEIRERPWFPEAIVALVRKTTAAAALLPRVTDAFAALAEAAHSDPEPGVRSRCLATLAAEEPDCPRTVAALDRALADPSDAVRIVAARALGDRGLPVLREIATRNDSDEDAAARAISLLARRLTSKESIAVLDSAIRAGRQTVARAAIESLGHQGDEPACERLRALLRSDEQSLAVAAADGLGFAHSTAAEQALLDALEAQSLDVRHAAVRAIGRVGQIASIAPLRAIVEDEVAAPELASAARQAIAAIQARLTGAEPGQVSLAEGESGQVSLASDSLAGRVTVTSGRSGAA